MNMEYKYLSMDEIMMLELINQYEMQEGVEHDTELSNELSAV